MLLWGLNLRTAEESAVGPLSFKENEGLADFLAFCFLTESKRSTSSFHAPLLPPKEKDQRLALYA